MKTHITAGRGKQKMEHVQQADVSAREGTLMQFCSVCDYSLSAPKLRLSTHKNERVPLVSNMPLFGAHCGTNQFKVGEQSESKGGAKSGATSFRRFVRNDLCSAPPLTRIMSFGGGVG